MEFLFRNWIEFIYIFSCVFKKLQKLHLVCSEKFSLLRSVLTSINTDPFAFFYDSHIEPIERVDYQCDRERERLFYDMFLIQFNCLYRLNEHPTWMSRWIKNNHKNKSWNIGGWNREVKLKEKIDLRSDFYSHSGKNVRKLSFYAFFKLFYERLQLQPPTTSSSSPLKS